MAQGLILEDDWTGKSSAKERRKLQNRLHQRAWRTPIFLHNACTQLISPPPGYVGIGSATPETNSHQLTLNNSVSPGKNAHQDLIHFDGDTRTLGAISSVTPICYANDIMNAPLSADHRLITLIQFNALRAFITNMSLTSSLNAIPTECHIQLSIVLPTPPQPPPTFTPTKLQRLHPHPYWVDSVPSPTLRDNLTIAIATGDPRFDEDALCGDMCGGLWDGYDNCAEYGILVWGEPWLVESWEVTQGFLRRWGWLLKDCSDMIRASNDWRESRGEERLIVEV
ncbi:hypothetical protein BU24DRAFT_437934 [Aaosphaeria arxii CBS 175.79]|uniref:Uncharacterized protein n=1 Tax=Aaosphaeria arxii CBS 175.79 TaxID=1450172 RepID=A0A6A5X642_9PLEO|nr:uncharacterized protein BU24DRAFT_437934 [Aaosphaeria arxii CBS 175.79]KAF2008392.1 hypothetical protein BU24DRAFT_437934 [Aaosphaeria arxii CBS 175.79]